MQNLTHVAWICELSVFLIGLGSFVHFLARDLEERGNRQNRGFPDGRAIRDGSVDPDEFGSGSILSNLIKTLQTRHELGYLQEESIIATLDDDIQGRGEILRDLSALVILVALFFTFFTLFISLGRTSGSLQAALSLVGVNWPGIGFGALLLVASTWARKRNQSLSQEYRRWLQNSVFPEIGGARSTADHLNAALRSLADTTDKLEATLAPVAGVRSVLEQFQSEILLKMLPQIVEAIKNTPLALSKESVRELHSAALESTKLLREIRLDYSKLVLESEAAERRNLSILEAVKSTCEHVDNLASSARDATGVVEQVRSTMDSLGSAVRASTVEAHGLGDLVLQTRDMMTSASERLAELGNIIERGTKAAADVASHLDSLQREVVGHAEVVSRSRASVDSLNLSLAQSRQQMVDAVGTVDRLGKGVEQHSGELAVAATKLAMKLDAAAAGASEALAGSARTVMDAAMRVDNAATSVVAALTRLPADGGVVEEVKELIQALQNTSNELLQLRAAVSVIGKALETLAPAVGEQKQIFVDIDETLHKSQGHLAQLNARMSDIREGLARPWYKKLIG